MDVTLPQWIVDFSAMLALTWPIIVAAAGFALGLEIAQEIIDVLTGGFWR